MADSRNGWFDGALFNFVFDDDGFCFAGFKIDGGVVVHFLEEASLAGVALRH